MQRACWAWNRDGVLVLRATNATAFAGRQSYSFTNKLCDNLGGQCEDCIAGTAHFMIDYLVGSEQDGFKRRPRVQVLG